MILTLIVARFVRLMQTSRSFTLKREANMSRFIKLYVLAAERRPTFFNMNKMLLLHGIGG